MSRVSCRSLSLPKNIIRLHSDTDFSFHSPPRQLVRLFGKEILTLTPRLEIVSTLKTHSSGENLPISPLKKFRGIYVQYLKLKVSRVSNHRRRVIQLNEIMKYNFLVCAYQLRLGV